MGLFRSENVKERIIIAKKVQLTVILWLKFDFEFISVPLHSGFIGEPLAEGGGGYEQGRSGQ